MRTLVGVCALVFSNIAWTDTAALVRAVEDCRTEHRPEARLSCYDNLDLATLAAVYAPRFAGELSEETERFDISTPTVLRYQSDGAIFVLSLHDDAGKIVQNLHIGGGGEDRYLITEAGRYFLRVNGSTTWRIWLEPQANPQKP